jgi:hypothetical protein
MKNPFYLLLVIVFVFNFFFGKALEYKLPVEFPFEYTFFDLLRIFLDRSRFLKSGIAWFFWGGSFVILFLIANRGYEKSGLNISEEIWKQTVALFLSGILMTTLGIFAPNFWPLLKNEYEFEIALFITALPLSAIFISSLGFFMFIKSRISP